MVVVIFGKAQFAGNGEASLQQQDVATAFVPFSAGQIWTSEKAKAMREKVVSHLLSANV